MVDSLQDRKMEDDLNSFPEDTTYCSVVVLRDYVSLLRFPLDTAPGGNLEALRFKWLEFMHPRLLDPRDLHLGKAIARQDPQPEES